MNSLIWLAVVSFGLSFILTPLCRNVFRSWGIVDKPDEDRKIHSEPIARGGGMALAISYALAIFFVQWRTGLVDENLTLIWKVLPAACTIFAVGIVDDIWGLKAVQKLFGQFIAACVACWSGVLVANVGPLHPRDWWTVPVTIFWLIACSNAFNLIDGMDGLAAGVGIFGALTMGVAALMQNNIALAMATIPLAGCLLGFLRYNFNPATVFLGDSGSLLIGFLLGCYGVVWTEKSATPLGMAAPLIALSLPLVDVALAIVRRFLCNKPIFAADRGHIHHRLLDRDLSPIKAVGLLYAICCVFSIFALLLTVVHDNAAASCVIVLLFCTVVWIGIRNLDYTEFSIAGRMFLGGGARGHLKSELDINTLQESFANAETAAECAGLADKAAGNFGLVATHMRIGGEDFAGPMVPTGSPWDVRVIVGDGDWIDLARVPGSTAGAALFLDALATSLSAKIPQLSKVRPRTVVIRSMPRQ